MKIIKNGTIFLKGLFQNKDILIEKDKIKLIQNQIRSSNYPNAQIIDAINKIITPTFTDVHVHFREPGQTYKENIETGVESAINGGYTNVITMPNTKPVIDNLEIVKSLQNKLNTQKINVKTFASLTLKQEGKILCSYKELIQNDLVFGFSDDGYGVTDDKVMEKAIQKSAQHNFIISAHLQDDKYCSQPYVINQGQKAEEFNVPSSPSEVEWKQAQRDIRLLQKYPKANYHMCHISTKETVELVRKAKTKGIKLSCEVTPHHLYLNSEMIPSNDGMWKMNPPLRSKEDSESLIQALNNGIIDIIATDHAPHSLAEKNKGFEKSLFGIIGLDFAFSSLYTYLVKTGKVKLETIIKALSINPSKIFKLKDSNIKEGNDATFLVINLNKKFILDEKFIKSKSKNTPLLGRELFGKIEQVYFKGNILNDK